MSAKVAKELARLEKKKQQIDKQMERIRTKCTHKKNGKSMLISWETRYSNRGFDGRFMGQECGICGKYVWTKLPDRRF